MKEDWKSRALRGAGIGIMMWWVVETLKQIGKIMMEIGR
jgi:hypothetical protein